MDSERRLGGALECNLPPSSMRCMPTSELTAIRLPSTLTSEFYCGKSLRNKNAVEVVRLSRRTNSANNWTGHREVRFFSFLQSFMAVPDTEDEKVDEDKPSCPICAFIEAGDCKDQHRVRSEKASFRTTCCTGYDLVKQPCMIRYRL